MIILVVYGTGRLSGIELLSLIWDIIWKNRHLDLNMFLPGHCLRLHGSVEKLIAASPTPFERFL